LNLAHGAEQDLESLHGCITGGRRDMQSVLARRLLDA
jgi:hypothetical protein